MKSVFKMLPVLLAVMLFVSCTNYGKKVAVEGTKGEVYYKGEGVNEAQAKKLGDYLKTSGMLSASDDKTKTAQITKQGDRYVVHFVINKDSLAKNPEVENVFKAMTAEIAKQVFDGQKTDIAFADDNLKDFKTIPYSEPVAQKPVTPDDNGNTNNGNTTGLLSDYDHDTMGGITFYWKGISDADSKTIAEYIVKNGAFKTSNNNVELIMDKDGDNYTIKFPVGESYNDNDAATQDELKKVGQEIKENVFPNSHYSLIVTDTRLNKIRSWDF